MSSILLEKLLQFGRTPVPQVNASKVVAAPQVLASQPLGTKGNNPFMVALDNSSLAFHNSFGANQPFERPVFFGHHGDRTLKGGARLFILS